jgi:hypothetical protein
MGGAQVTISADWSMSGGQKPEVNTKPPPDAKISGASVAARRASLK